MKISGVTVIDLSGYVDGPVLMLNDRQVREVHDRVYGLAGRYVVDIGAAKHTEWDPRVVMLLRAADEVQVRGRDEDGVGQAVRALLLAVESVPGPRGVS